MNKQVRRFVLAILIFHARQLVGCTTFLPRSRTGRIVVAFAPIPWMVLRLAKRAR
jgi:hypothetical protein